MDDRGLARKSDPHTSHSAADTVSATKLMDQIYVVMATFGYFGCISDDVGDALPNLDSNSYTPRFKPMIKRGMIETTGGTRAGRSGKQQLIRRVKPRPFIAIEVEDTPTRRNIKDEFDVMYKKLDDIGKLPHNRGWVDGDDLNDILDRE